MAKRILSNLGKMTNCYGWHFLVHADKYECGRLFIPLNCLDKIYDYKSAFRIIILIVSIFIIVNLFLEPIALKRFMKFGSAISTFDIHKIYSADQSAALRVIPSFICLQK